MTRDHLLGYAPIAQWIAEEHEGRKPFVTKTPKRFTGREQHDRRVQDKLFTNQDSFSLGSWIPAKAGSCPNVLFGLVNNVEYKLVNNPEDTCRFSNDPGSEIYREFWEKGKFLSYRILSN